MLLSAVEQKQEMNRFWVMSALLFVAGIGITVAGFAYDIMFAGIPFQDPPKQLQDQYVVHSHIAATMEVVGLLTAAAAVIVAAIALVRRSTDPRRRTRE